MNIAAVGTAISFSKFLFLPHSPAIEGKSFSFKNWGFWGAIALLLGGLIFANGFYLDAYKFSNFPKALITIVIGWGVYWLVFQRLSIKLPRVVEQFEHLVGAMSLVLTGLFWMVAA